VLQLFLGTFLAMSHHYSGPEFGSPHDDARLDFTDLFAFPKPGDKNTSVLIMDVHPSVNVKPPGPTMRDPFSPDAVYEIKIDTNGDNVADIAYRFRFSPLQDGKQTATWRRADGDAAAGIGDDGRVIVENAPVSTGRDAQITKAGNCRFFAGWRSDPFFFDVEGALNNLQFTGKDYFADKDVCSIVLELPNSELGSRPVRLWARTVDARNGKWVQADRGARAQQTPFLPGDDRDAYLAGEPANDSRFIATFAHSLEHSGGYTPDEARRVAEAMLPDVLPYDPTRQAVYPTNGRLLTDSVVEYFIPLFSNGKVKTDKTRAHNDLLSEFPYVGPPHNS
jgi:hypothetical protein